MNDIQSVDATKTMNTILENLLNAEEQQGYLKKELELIEKNNKRGENLESEIAEIARICSYFGDPHQFKKHEVFSKLKEDCENKKQQVISELKTWDSKYTEKTNELNSELEGKEEQISNLGAKKEKLESIMKEIKEAEEKLNILLKAKAEGNLKPSEEPDIEFWEVKLDGLKLEIHGIDENIIVLPTTKMDTDEIEIINLDDFRLDFKRELEAFAEMGKDAINAVQGYMNADEAKEGGGFSIDTLVSALNMIVPPNIKTFIAVAKLIYSTISQEIKKSTPGNKVPFSDIHNTWFNSFETFRKASHDGEWEEFKKVFLKNHDDDFTKKDVEDSIRGLKDKLMSSKDIQKAIVNAWVDGSEDGSDGDDWAGVIELHLIVKGPSWMLSESTKPFIDDVEDGDGTLNALVQTYGKDWPLYKLPFPIKVYLYTPFMDSAEAWRSSKVVGNGDFKYSSGDQKIFDSFMRYKAYKIGTLGDLEPD